MKIKTIIFAIITLAFLFCLVVFPNVATSSAAKGLGLCSTVIIPSLFPFMACCLILFETKFLEKLTEKIEPITNKVFSLSSCEFSVFLLSLIGGYPVGAKLVERLYSQGVLAKVKAETMLLYCVNSGPSFVVIAVGAKMLQNQNLGYILLCSNTIASIILAICSSLFLKRTKLRLKGRKTTFSFSESIIKSTFEASGLVLNICALVILFSCLYGIIDFVFIKSPIKDILLSLLEITTAIAYSHKNIYIVSFLLGFAGFCVHFQVLSVSKSINISFLKFLIFRFMHGILSAFITFLLLKIFKVTVPTISFNSSVNLVPTKYTTLFSVALILLSFLFILTTKKSSKTI